MEEVVRQDILEVLTQAIEALGKGDSFTIKELSNNVIHDASIFQDEDSLQAAVFMYSLSKIMERGRLELAGIKSLMERAKRALDSHNEEDYRLAVKFAIRKISEADSRLKLFVGSVIEQAELKKGGKLVMHGISTARAASMLGISRWDLMQYLGRTTFHEDHIETVSAIERLRLTRKVFGNGPQA